MFLQTDYTKSAVLLIGISFAVSGMAQTDPIKAYSTFGITYGETLRVDVVNVTDPSAFAPPCNVQIGFVNAAGVLLKSTNASIPVGHAAFFPLTFAEGSASSTAADTRTRLNIRPVLNTYAPPCRTVSSVEVFDAFLGRTHAYAVPVESPDSTNGTPPGPPVFAMVGLTALDALRVNVTNITGSNGIPPGPCNVQMGFVNAAGDTIKMVGGTIEAGHTASLVVTYNDVISAAAPARVNVRPVVGVPPGPCAAPMSAELVDAFTGMTMVEIRPAFQGNLVIPMTGVGTVAQ